MKITLLPGDGIGVEIVDAAVEVLDAAAKKYNFTVEYDKMPWKCWTQRQKNITLPLNTTKN